MKLCGILILFPLVVSLVLPLTSHLSVSPFNNAKYLIGFDVCNSADPMTPANSDNFLLNECVCRPVPFGSAKYIDPDNLSFIPYLHFVQLEHPPRS